MHHRLAFHLHRRQNECHSVHQQECNLAAAMSSQQLYATCNLFRTTLTTIIRDQLHTPHSSVTGAPNYINLLPLHSSIRFLIQYVPPIKGQTLDILRKCIMVIIMSSQGISHRLRLPRCSLVLLKTTALVTLQRQYSLCCKCTTSSVPGLGTCIFELWI